MQFTAPATWERKRIERYLALAAILVMAVTAFLGLKRNNADLEQVFSDVLPAAVRFEPLGNQSFAGYSANTATSLIGYIKISEADGYGGPLKVAVVIDPKGVISAVRVIEQRETADYFKRVRSSELLHSLVGKGYQDELRLGDDVDGVSSATFTSRAIVSASRLGLRSIASGELDLDVPREILPKVLFGVPELVLILLIAVWYVGDRKGFQLKRQARWFTLLTSMVFLGFLYTSLLTLPFITKILMGFWPQWQNSLYWYTLFGFFLLVFLIKGKNPYCQWICPFGAVQETLGMIGGAKSRSPKRFAEFFRWLPRGLAFTAVLAALLFRNPGISSYEVFGTLFDLEGSPFQFGLLGAVLISSFLIKRPWCRFLCPIGAIYDFLRTLRGLAKKRWRRTA
ncbi:MAG: 4Fe-4S binding protein [Deltaproteobacteria bacterium]|nr:4Fe-4S binding protein [Deltaproteobacteria bacterium]